MVKYDIGNAAFRKAQEFGQNDAPEGEAHRCLPWCSVNLDLLLVLSLRSAFGADKRHGRVEEQDVRMAFARVFESLIGRLPKDSSTLSIVFATIAVAHRSVPYSFELHPSRHQHYVPWGLPPSARGKWGSSEQCSLGCGACSPPHSPKTVATNTKPQPHCSVLDLPRVRLPCLKS